LAFGFWIETSIETCTGIRVPGSLLSFFAVAGFLRALRCSGNKERKKDNKRSKKTRWRKTTTTTTSKKKRGRSSRELNEVAVYFWTE
jgi:hypothetical protein